MNHLSHDDAEASGFLPSLTLISRHIVDDPNGGDDVIVPRKLLRFVIRCLLDHTEFDEQQYQRSNPDVAEAIRCREFASGHDHFLSVGYFEGHMGATPVQESSIWRGNPDVAAAKRAGHLESGELQDRLAGAQEWREPNPHSVRTHIEHVMATTRQSRTWSSSRSPFRRRTVFGATARSTAALKGRGPAR